MRVCRPALVGAVCLLAALPAWAAADIYPAQIYPAQSLQSPSATSASSGTATVPVLPPTSAQPAGPVPLTLAAAVSEAIEHNLGLLADKYNLDVARAAVVTANLRPNPVLTFNTMLPDHGIYETATSPREAIVRADLPFERGGKRDRRVAQAQAAATVTELQLLNSTRQLVLDVESAFVDIQRAQLDLTLARENLEAFEQVVQVNVERVRTGDLAAVELSRSRLAALQFRNDVLDRESKLRVARQHLSQLLGRPGRGHALEITGELRREATPLNYDSLRAAAIDRRPDLRAARAEQARSAADLRLQIANRVVDLTVSAEYHHQQAPSLAGNATLLAVSVPLPIFNRNQGEITRTRVQQTQSEARTAALQQQIESELQSAFAGYTAARDTLQRIETGMLSEARDVRTTMEYSYRRGEASLVEFLDAVRAFNDTMQNYNDARAEHARSLFTLDALSGQATTE